MRWRNHNMGPRRRTGAPANAELLRSHRPYFRHAHASFARDAVAFGVFARAGRSLALFGGPFKGVSRLYGYGELEAEERLMKQIESWRESGEPTEDVLEIQVRFEAERQRLRWRWKTASA
jgi:hypothetical protein